MANVQRYRRAVVPESEMARHRELLGIASEKEYLGWCRQHGFKKTLRKTWDELERERGVANRTRAVSKMAVYRKKARRLADDVQQVLTGKLAYKDVPSPELANLATAFYRVKRDRLATRALQALVDLIAPLKEVLDERPVFAGLGQDAGNTLVGGLASLALRHATWRRPLDDWKPQSKNMRRRFASLVRYLFADYEVPEFLDVVWFKAGSKVEQQWWIHIGRGQNIRTAALPIPFTKRMAHHFLRTPRGYSVEEALRWGQIHGLGGDTRLAEAIRETRLCGHFDNDDFWCSVLRFFIANPMLDTQQIGPIIDYLHNQKFVPQEVWTADGQFERHPPRQPNLSMKGRDPIALLNQVERWHRGLAKQNRGRSEWRHSGIGEFEWIEGSAEAGNMKRWTIRELLSSGQLQSEGRKMRHCVATYAQSCARRSTSIWSLELESATDRCNMLTIEVKLSNKVICQARGKYNALPKQNALQVLGRWATREGLTVPSYLAS